MKVRDGRQSHGTIKKLKAYGAVGVITLAGSLSLLIGTGTLSADEMTADSSPKTGVVAESEVTDTAAIEEAFGSDEGVAESAETASAETISESEITASTITIDDSSSELQSEIQFSGADGQHMTADSSAAEMKSLSIVSEEETVNDNTEETPLSQRSTDEAADQSDLARSSISVAETNEVLAAATGLNVTETTSVGLTRSGIAIQYNQSVSQGAELLFAVWSDNKGQDDLVWYIADSSGKTTASYTGDYGIYNIHTYERLAGRMTYLDARTIDITKPAVTAAVSKSSGTTYQVTVSNVPAYITNLVLPTWTTKNDQDDIIWYNASQNNDGTYTATVSVAAHHLESGTYIVHVYGKSTVTNSLIGLAATSFVNDYTFGDVEVMATLGEKGIDISMPSDVSSNLAVYHAVWSDQNGQDDLVWYRAADSGQTTAAYTGSYGTYEPIISIPML